MVLPLLPSPQDVETLAGAARFRAFSSLDPLDEFRLESAELFAALLADYREAVVVAAFSGMDLFETEVATGEAAFAEEEGAPSWEEEEALAWAAAHLGALPSPAPAAEQATEQAPRAAAPAAEAAASGAGAAGAAAAAAAEAAAAGDVAGDIDPELTALIGKIASRALSPHWGAAAAGDSSNNLKE